MEFYHGTPLGASKAQTAEFVANRLVLVPYHRPRDLDVVLRVARGFVLDNGAYHYWQQGYEEYPDYDGYTTWVCNLSAHPRFRWAIMPDHITGTEAQNNAYLDRWPKHLPGVPVFHMHHDLGRLRWLAQHYPIVALGGGVGYEKLKTPQWWARMRQIMDAVTDDYGRPLCQLHGLRILDPQIFTQFPLSSGDSTNAARNSGDATRCPPHLTTRAQRANYLANRVERFDAAPKWHKQLSLF